MKETLISLIDDIHNIEKLFYTPAIPDDVMMVATEHISDRQEYQIWRQKVLRELHEIYSFNADEFIKGTIDALSEKLNSWHEREDFNEIKGKLLAIRENIDDYYILATSEQGTDKTPMIFISHSTGDKKYAELLVNLFESMGLDEQTVFCSSVPGYDVKLGKDIYEHLRSLFQTRDLHIIYLLSKNFYNSPASLNEMGAAWVLRKEVTSILLPGFDFSEMKGVVNNREIAIKLDEEETELKDKLNQLYEKIIEEFSLKKKSTAIWERKRDNFIQNVREISYKGTVIGQDEKISKEAEELLLNASKTDSSYLLISTTLSGTTIQTTPKCYSSAMGDREFSRWEAALDELIKGGYMVRYGKSNNLLKLTDKGYTYLENRTNG